MNFCLPVGLISSSNGLFPEVDFKLLEFLRAGSSSDVAETRLSTKFIYIYIALKTTDKKMSCILNSYQNTYTFKNGNADCFGKILWDLLWESKINANACTYAQERI